MIFSSVWLLREQILCQVKMLQYCKHIIGVWTCYKHASSKFDTLLEDDVPNFDVPNEKLGTSRHNSVKPQE